MKPARIDPPGGDALLINVVKAGPPGGDVSPINAASLDMAASYPLDLFDLSRRLQQAGWDALASDLAGQVAARQDQRPDRAAWSLVIDRSGRWRCTITRPVGLADTRQVAVDGQSFHLLDEIRQITTMTGKLRRAADLPELLAGLAEAARQAHHAAGDARWQPSEDPAAALNNR